MYSVPYTNLFCATLTIRDIYFSSRYRRVRMAVSLPKWMWRGNWELRPWGRMSVRWELFFFSCVVKLGFLDFYNNTFHLSEPFTTLKDALKINQIANTFLIVKPSAGLLLHMVVQVCERTGDLLVCDGHCYGAFHLRCIGLSAAPKGKFICQECKTGAYAFHIGIWPGVGAGLELGPVQIRFHSGTGHYITLILSLNVRFAEDHNEWDLHQNSDVLI